MGTSSAQGDECDGLDVVKWADIPSKYTTSRLAQKLDVGDNSLPSMTREFVGPQVQYVRWSGAAWVVVVRYQ